MFIANDFQVKTRSFSYLNLSLWSNWPSATRTIFSCNTPIDTTTKTTVTQEKSLKSCVTWWNDWLVSEYVYSGSLLELRSATHFKIKAEFHRNSTESLTHFHCPVSNNTCLAFIGQSLPGLDIYCYEADQKVFYWTQRIDLDGIYKVTHFKWFEKRGKCWKNV